MARILKLVGVLQHGMQLIYIKCGLKTSHVNLSLMLILPFLGVTTNRLSDHRPVFASYMIEVEVLSLRKLQKALTFTNIEIKNYEIIASVSFRLQTTQSLISLKTHNM